MYMFVYVHSHNANRLLVLLRRVQRTVFDYPSTAPFSPSAVCFHNFSNTERLRYWGFDLQEWIARDDPSICTLLDSCSRAITPYFLFGKVTNFNSTIIMMMKKTRKESKKLTVKLLACCEVRARRAPTRNKFAALRAGKGSACENDCMS